MENPSVAAALPLLVNRVREPLLLPLGAIMAGIALSRFVRFEWREICAAAIGFVSFYLIARRRGGKWLRFAILALVLVAAGVAIEVARRPGPPPEFRP